VGYAFVDLSTPTEAKRAIEELNGQVVLERKLSIQIARKPESDGVFGGGEGTHENENRRRSSTRGRGTRGRGRGGRTARGGRTVSWAFGFCLDSLMMMLGPQG
jgi:RNA recognition motif-containing protein